MKTKILGYEVHISKPSLKRFLEIWRKPSEGFGDTVAKVTKTFGIQPCEACERRRRSWNKRLRYKKIQLRLKRIKEKILGKS